MPPIRYRRRPEEVEVFYYTEENAEEIMEWAAGKRMKWDGQKAAKEAPILVDMDDGELFIFRGVGKEREVFETCYHGTFIVKGADGTFRAVDYNEFVAQYDPA